MGENAVLRRRRRDRSVTEAARLAAAYKSSGLSRQEFCKRNDVTLSTLARYVKRHGKQKAESAESERLLRVEMLPMEGPPGSELLVVLSNGRRIEVRRGFDAHTFEQLIDLLERF